MQEQSCITIFLIASLSVIFQVFVRKLLWHREESMGRGMDVAAHL